MPRVKIREIDIYYEAKGNGPRLLYIGGTGGRPQRQAEHIREPPPTALHHPGIRPARAWPDGEPDKPYTMADYAYDARELAQSIGWSSSHVMGVSFGGMVAQEYAIRYHEMVNRLVLACTSSGGEGGASYPLHELAGLSPEHRAGTLIGLLDNRRGESWRNSNPEKYREALNQMMAPSPFQGEAGRDVGARRQLEARRNHDTYSRLPKLGMPVYICGGKYDGLSVPENLEALHRQIPGSRLEFFEGGHMFLKQDPEAYNRIIISYIANDFSMIIYPVPPDLVLLAHFV